jgi:PAT family beta-lactamase induction signal transducer AmpG
MPEPQEEPERPAEGRGLRSPHLWVTSTYFAEGFPYALVNNIAELLFQALGASLQAIGLTAIFHLPWNLKFLWAPALDRYETKRRFMLGCEIVVLVLVLLLAVLGESTTLAMLAFVFILLAIVSATHDIAIDAFYLEALDEKGQSKYVGYRAAAYRGSVLLASGPILIVVGALGWRIGWLLCALVMAAILAYHWRYLPRVERLQPPVRTWFTPRRVRALAAAAAVFAAVVLSNRLWSWWVPLRAWWNELIRDVPFFGELSLEGWIGVVLLTVVVVALASLGRLRDWLARHDSPYARAFLHLLDRPLMGRALAFIVLFRTGESFLMKMRMPFLRQECGMDIETFGLINGTLGWSATLLATLVGGWLIARHGLRRWLWPFVLAQNIPNLLYAWAAGQPDPGALGSVVLGTVVVGEDIGAGLGTAVFMVYLMRCVDPRHKATHMAVLTAIMSIGFTLAGVASGFLADMLGFQSYFVMTFLATVPSMLLLPFVPYLDPSPAAPADRA